MEENLRTTIIKPILGNSTFILILPKDYVVELNLDNEDYVKCCIDSERLIVERSAKSCSDMSRKYGIDKPSNVIVEGTENGVLIKK